MRKELAENEKVITRLTAEQIKAIEEMNGTMESRYDYFEEFANIIGVGNSFAVRYNKNKTKRLHLDNMIVDITTRTKKGKLMIVRINLDATYKVEGTDTRDGKPYKYYLNPWIVYETDKNNKFNITSELTKCSEN